MLFAGLIGAVAVAFYGFKLNAVTAFWFAFVLTRPLGASLGDFLIQAPANGGLGINILAVNVGFLAAIVGLVSYEALRIKRALAN
ncbi:MAG: hypothetical protein WBM58_13130 [Sedimenticolaceae bacterium]